MAYKKAADGIVSKGKTNAKVLPNSGPKSATVSGGTGGEGGKTDAEMLKLGRNLAKLANQKRG